MLYLIESRTSEPIVNPGLFKNRIFSVSVVATFLVSVGFFGAIMYLPLFVQCVLGDTATGSGSPWEDRARGSLSPWEGRAPCFPLPLGEGQGEG